MLEFYFDENYKIQIPTRDDWSEGRVDLNDEVVCFTDGSRLTTTGPTGIIWPVKSSPKWPIMCWLGR